MTETEFRAKVEKMNNKERSEYRKELETSGDSRYLYRPLSYNYSTQEWID